MEKANRVRNGTSAIIVNAPIELLSRTIAIKDVGLKSSVASSIWRSTGVASVIQPGF